MLAPYLIDPAMKRLLEAELRPGERVLWCQQPRALPLIKESLATFAFGIPFFSLPAYVLFQLFSVQWHETAWAICLLILCFFGFFAVIGAGMLLSPLWALRKAWRTLYAVTDRRCLTICAPFRRTIYSYVAGPGLGELTGLHRIEDRCGRGDLVFHQQAVSRRRRVYYHNIGFIGIRDVRDAEVKVRDLIDQTGTASSGETTVKP